MSAYPTFSSFFINVVSLITSSFGLYQCSLIVLPPTLSQAGHKQFLTNLSVAATILNNVANIVNYFIQRNKNAKSQYGSDSDFISRHVTLPLALVLESIVTTVYWPLRLFAMELIVQDAPSRGASPIPLEVDLSIHLFPIVFLLCDHYLSGSGCKFQLSRLNSWLIITALGMGYNRFLNYLIDPTSIQKYPYPFLNVDEPLKSVIFVAVTSASWMYYLLYQSFPPIRRNYKQDAKTD